ncbi:MAG: HAMP domain-containing protein, partial [Candidatus Binatia bacterium]
MHPNPPANRPRVGPFAHLSITTKLVLIVFVFVAIVFALTLLVNGVMKVKSAARAYIYAEGLWSKGQKDAVYYLTLYVLSGDDDDYQRFREAIAVPLGDHRARIELEKETFDRDVVVEGFIAGRNHPDEIPSMIFLFRWFRNVDFVARPIEYWTAGDVYIQELVQVAETVREELRGGPIPHDRQHELLDQIAGINARLTPLEQAFSAALAAGTRQMSRSLPAAILAVTAVLLLAGIGISLLLARQLRGSILRLREGALRVARGEFGQALEIDSRDELGDLASAFNEMTVQR